MRRLLVLLAACSAPATRDPPADARARSGDLGGDLGGPDGPATPDPRELQIGTGVEDGPDFIEYPADHRVTLNYGPQGGYHIYTQVRVRGIDPTYPRIWIRAVDPASGQVMRDVSQQSGMVPDGHGWYVFPQAVRTFMCPPVTSDWDMYDHLYDLVVRVQAEHGGWIEGTIPSMPYCPDPDLQPSGALGPARTGLCRTSPVRGCHHHHGGVPPPPPP